MKELYMKLGHKILIVLPTEGLQSICGKNMPSYYSNNFKNTNKFRNIKYYLKYSIYSYNNVNYYYIFLF